MSIVSALGPVVLGLVIGLALRARGVGTAENGRFLLQLNFFVCLPALVFPAVATAEVQPSLLLFPSAAVVMVVVGYVTGRLVAARALPGPGDRAVVTTSYMVVNCAFALPFVGAVYGPEGVLRVAAFDLVHGLLVATVVLGVAARADPSTDQRPRRVWHQVVRTPLIHAMAAGAVVNAAGWTLPGAVDQSLQPFAAASLAVVALGCGLVVEPVHDALRISGLAVVRLLSGLAVAGAMALALGLEGTDLGVLLMLGATPLGFIVVTFAAIHGLGTRLSANLLLVSLALSVATYSAFGVLVG